MFIMEIKVILIRPLIKKVSKLHVCINMLMPDKTPIHTTLEIIIYVHMYVNIIYKYEYNYISTNLFIQLCIKSCFWLNMFV